MYLTKSDFKACFDCATRLFYRKNKYPTAADENDYLQFLADGGFMVELIAKAHYPEGVDLVDLRDPDQSWSRTRDLFARGDATIFEAGIVHEKYHIRVDILRRRGKVIELIEVKSSGLDDDEDDAVSPFLTKNGKSVLSRWKKYILDVAFQAHVLRLAFPGFEVRPALCVVNKAALAQEAETLGNFTLRKDPANSKARPTVHYRGDIAALARSTILVKRPVHDECAVIEAEVIQRAGELAALIRNGQVQRAVGPLTEQYALCRKCDYRVARTPSGFLECWKNLAMPTPHILDLHRVSQIGGANFPDPVPELLNSGRASYLDLREDQLGKDGTYTARRRLQWRSMRDGGTEMLSPELVSAVQSHARNPGWPLHFIDFEACDLALPHHAGLRPFERVAFQWSCHTLNEAGDLSHREWLNDQREFPNLAFVRSLRQCLGESGTVYVWSWYEHVTLRKIFEQLSELLLRDPDRALTLAGAETPEELRDLAAWLERFIGPADAKGKRIGPRIRDLHQLASDYYFHPRMAGRTSIKVVLPSVWESDARLQSHPCFAGYLVRDERGVALDPYKSLPSLPFGDDDDEDNAVREGTGAIRVYQDLIFDEGATAEVRAARRQLLLQYCGLDTAAMVMIWAHWLKKYDFRPVR